MFRIIGLRDDMWIDLPEITLAAVRTWSEQFCYGHPSRDKKTWCWGTVGGWNPATGGKDKYHEEAINSRGKKEGGIKVLDITAAHVLDHCQDEMTIS